MIPIGLSFYVVCILAETVSDADLCLRVNYAALLCTASSWNMLYVLLSFSCSF
jgi:hypothetical protein